MNFSPYSTSSPRGPDLPSETQIDHLNNFMNWNEVFGVDHIPFGNIITNATSANPCIVTVPNNRFLTGWTVEIRGLKGLDENGEDEDWSVNTQTTTITVDAMDNDLITLDTIDASGEKPYIANTGSITVTATGGAPFYGLHKQVTFQGPIPDPIDNVTIDPKSVLYVRDFEDVTEILEPIKNLIPNILSFITDQENPVRLTRQDLGLSSSTGLPTWNQRGFKTPFGFTINFGDGGVPPAATANMQRTIDLKVAYDTTHYFTLITPKAQIRSNNTIVNNTYILVPTKNLTSFDFLPQNFLDNIGVSFYFISMGV